MSAFYWFPPTRSLNASACRSPGRQAVLLGGIVLFLFTSSPFETVAGSVSLEESCRGSMKRQVLTNYCDNLYRNYLDSVLRATELLEAVELLVGKPSEESMFAAREAWLRARIPYGQTEVARFYDGPIDQTDGLINAWPVDESYIDYVSGRPEAGIINMVAEYPSLTEELLAALNEKEGEKNISSGFHAIEFLLWGQDVSPEGPGDRPWTDYARNESNAGRRGAFLVMTTRSLVKHLQSVADAWVGSDPVNYRTKFLSMDSNVSLGMILKGAGVLSGPELSGERLTVAYVTKEQENEQSCFSDSTHVDVIQNAVGVENVYLGRYLDVAGKVQAGPGVHDLLSEQDARLAESLARQIKDSVAAARAIPAPFDRAVMGGRGSSGRQAIKEAYTSLQIQSDLIAKAAKVLGLEIGL